MALYKFDKDDNEYLQWMSANPFCFIVNTRRVKDSNLFVLHKSKCSHIASTAGLDKGAYTERNYVKIVSSDINELRNWFKENNTKFKGEFTECKTCNSFSEKFIENPVFLFPEIIEDEKTVFFEGAKKQITVNAYERNFKARQECLKHYGYACSVCDIDFSKIYGIIGKDFIHVHHLKEIYAIGNTYKIDPISDLRPVCPNCHSMLHQRKPCYSIDELKQIITIQANENDLPEHAKAGIERARKQADAELLTPHEEVIKKYAKYL
jgi:hypothetical protein